LAALLFKGLITGFILTIMVGPVFFVLLETSIRRGVKAAVAIDIGVLISDLLYISAAYFFYSQVKDVLQGDKQDILKLAGGVLFLIYGIITYFKKLTPPEVDEVGKVLNTSGDYVKLALKGFILNFTNPLVIFYWFSVITLGAKSSDKVSADDSSILLYLVVILVTFFSFDLLKIFGARKLRPLVTDRVLTFLNQLIGVVFFCFGIFLVAKGIVGIVKT
jgi:threonine/homoserine/homoserine lactone efflux protein